MEHLKNAVKSIRRLALYAAITLAGLFVLGVAASYVYLTFFVSK